MIYSKRRKNITAVKSPNVPVSVATPGRSPDDALVLNVDHQIVSVDFSHTHTMLTTHCLPSTEEHEAAWAAVTGANA